MRFNHFFLFLISVTSAEIESFFDTSTSSDEGLVGVVGNLVNTWNKRHSSRNDVLLFEVGSKNGLANDLLAIISGEHAILLPKPFTLLKETPVKPSFLLLLSDMENLVSKT